MSANLDKSLDEIISSKPRAPRAPRGRSRRTVAVRKGVSKSAAPSAAKKAVAKKAAPAAAPKLNVLDEASKLADRIIISNLVCTRSWIIFFNFSHFFFDERTPSTWQLFRNYFLLKLLLCSRIGFASLVDNSQHPCHSFCYYFNKLTRCLLTAYRCLWDRC